MRQWSSTAFNATPEDEWLVIKVPRANRSHFMCDFCDGDELDNYEWLEGGFKQELTVRQLLEYRRGRTRMKRRDITDEFQRRTQVRTFPSEAWERHSVSTVDHDTTSEDEDYEAYKMNKEIKISAIQNFRNRVAYNSKPSLSDLLASKESESEEEVFREGYQRKPSKVRVEHGTCTRVLRLPFLSC